MSCVSSRHITKLKQSIFAPFDIYDTNIYTYLQTSSANVIKLFTTVIYCGSTAIPSFCVIK